MGVRHRFARTACRIKSSVNGLVNDRDARSSITDQRDYVALCDAAARDDAVFASFRRQSVYRDTLDHVTPEQGAQCLSIIERRSHSFLESRLGLIRQIDAVGEPFTHDYGAHGEISPTTLRYAKILSDLELRFGDLEGADVVEIGVGFGGQARLVMEHWSLGSYTLIDLEPVLRLANRCLGTLKAPAVWRLMSPEELVPLRADLVISNYAFTELERAVQDEYAESVVRSSSKAYMACNFISRLHGIDSWSRQQLEGLNPGARWLPEEPLTNEGNAILVWGDERDKT